MPHIDFDVFFGFLPVIIPGIIIALVIQFKIYNYQKSLYQEDNAILEGLGCIQAEELLSLLDCNYEAETIVCLIKRKKLYDSGEKRVIKFRYDHILAHLLITLWRIIKYSFMNIPNFAGIVLVRVFLIGGIDFDEIKPSLDYYDLIMLFIYILIILFIYKRYGLDEIEKRNLWQNLAYIKELGLSYKLGESNERITKKMKETLDRYLKEKELKGKYSK